jgi:hypothetical protein
MLQQTELQRRNPYSNSQTVHSKLALSVHIQQFAHSMKLKNSLQCLVRLLSLPRFIRLLLSPMIPLGTMLLHFSGVPPQSINALTWTPSECRHNRAQLRSNKRGTYSEKPILPFVEE